MSGGPSLLSYCTSIFGNNLKVGLKQEVVRSVAPRKLYTMEAGLSYAIYSVLQLSQRFAVIYYSHCRFLSRSTTGPSNLQKKSYFQILHRIQFPICDFEIYIFYQAPLRETTSAVPKGVITRSFLSPPCFHIPFPRIPGQCFQHLPLSVCCLGTVI